MRRVLLFVLLALSSECLGKQGFGPGEQEWGYVTVRPKAHMFWWLYFTTAKVDSYYEKPLIIWLQGGPGASSTSYGNFEELGPLDTSLRPRNYTWVKDYNVLFIDNPVGTGYSYVDDKSVYALTNKQIADDLVECMRGFYQKLPQFADVPTYITTESYGGKMGAEFALEWYKAQKAGTIKSNLKGVGLGDSWVSPIDSVMTWAPFLLATGMIDKVGYDRIESAAVRTRNAVESGQWTTATDLWSYTENVILDVTNNIDFYNILSQTPPRIQWPRHSPANRLENLETSYNLHVLGAREPDLDGLMNGPVRKALGVSVDHGGQSRTVFAQLSEDFMKPVTDVVEKLLNETIVDVFVYSGHMDLIVDTPGTVQWVERLKWKNANDWLNAHRTAVIAGNVIEGYVKAYGRLKMYWVNRAGHMVPRDNPAGMAMILEDLTTEHRL